MTGAAIRGKIEGWNSIDTRQNGAILVWFALMLVALFLVASLAIDFQINSSSESEQTYTAEYLSLAALESYSSNGGTYSQNVQAARDRVAELAKQSFLIGTPGQSQADGTSDFGVGSNDMQATGTVVPGIWYYDDPGCPSGTAPSNVEGCPCAGIDFPKACFRPNQTGDTAANAFKIKLQTKHSVVPWLSRLFGIEGTDLTANATATLIPKEVVFLLDLSRSTTFDTHRPAPTGSFLDGVDYSWRLDEDDLPGLASYCSNHTNPCRNRDYDVQSYYQNVVDTNTNNGQSSNCSWPPEPYSEGDAVGCLPETDTDSDPATDPSSGTIDFSQGLCGCVAQYSQNCQPWPCYAVLQKTAVYPTVPTCCSDATPCTDPLCACPSNTDPVCQPTYNWWWDVTYCTACWWELNDLQCSFEGNPESADGAVNLTYRYNENVISASSPNTVYDTDHRKEDYRCYQTSGVDLDQDGVDDRYLFDTVQNGGYKGPQPLTSILNGVERALDIINQRAVDGDRIGLIGFDQTMDRMESRCIGLLNRHDSDFALMRRILKENPSTSDLEERFNHMFFPRYEANTSIPLALNWGGYLFAEENCASIPGAMAADMAGGAGFVDRIPYGDHVHRAVVLFSDGLSNCTGSACDAYDYYTHHQSLFKDIPDLVDYYVDGKIPINVMMFGNSVAPHTVLRRGIDSECMSDAEARSLGDLYVDGNSDDPVGVENAYLNLPTQWGTPISDGANPYFLENAYFFAGEYLHTQMAAPTKGIFAAIRPACHHSVVGASDLADCNNRGDELLSTICANSGASQRGLITHPDLTDSDSRMVCDPSCRDKQEQVADFIEEIYGLSPYILVE